MCVYIYVCICMYTLCICTCSGTYSHMNTNVHTYIHAYIYENLCASWLPHIQTYKRACILAYRRTERQTDRQTDRPDQTETDRQTDRQTETGTKTYVGRRYVPQHYLRHLAAKSCDSSLPSGHHNLLSRMSVTRPIEDLPTVSPAVCPTPNYESSVGSTCALSAAEALRLMDKILHYPL